MFLRLTNSNNLTLETGSLLSLLSSNSLGALVQLGLGLETHNSTSPLTNQIRVLVELLHSKILEGFELSLIRLVNSGKGHDGSSLLVAEGSKTGLVLDNKEGHLHLTAESREPQDQFDGVNVTGNEDERSLLLFNERGHVLETEFELVGDLSRGVRFGGDRGGRFLDALFLGSGGFRAVLVQESEDTGGLVLSDRLGELVDGRGDFETLVKDSALTLNADVLGPLDESGKITALGTNSATNGERAGFGGEEGIGLGWSLGGRCLRLRFGGSFLGCHDCSVDRWLP